MECKYPINHKLKQTVDPIFEKPCPHFSHQRPVQQHREVNQKIRKFSNPER